jgi:hypothetical protein
VLPASLQNQVDGDEPTFVKDTQLENPNGLVSETDLDAFQTA